MDSKKSFTILATCFKNSIDIDFFSLQYLVVAQLQCCMQRQALNMHNKLNVASGLMHLQCNAQQEKKIGFFILYLHND
jgi:hypothetical protein